MRPECEICNAALEDNGIAFISDMRAAQNAHS